MDEQPLQLHHKMDKGKNIATHLLAISTTLIVFPKPLFEPQTNVSYKGHQLMALTLFK
jgi:hypothetical protein